MGQPIRVTVGVLTGAAIAVRVWLEDEHSDAVLQASAGIEGDVIVRLVPRVAGQWQLKARGIDANGCDGHTTVPRTVTVAP